MQLEQLGWTEFFAQQGADGRIARVAAAGRKHFVVWTEYGEIDVEPSGGLRYASELWPVVGDWVVLREDGPSIERVLQRRTTVARQLPGGRGRQVMAANVDVLFIVTALGSEYNARRLERYLVLARESGARPVIVLNKVDLADRLNVDMNDLLNRTQALAEGAHVLALSASSDPALDTVAAELLPGETAAMIGSSGVGKSTILNRLLGKERQKTASVRDGDDKGRHTTTTRELFRMPGGWLLIDMPGLREVQLWAETEAIDASFEDVQALAAQCRFRDCAHAGEPGCAVVGGGLDATRLANYQKMRREVEYLAIKADPELERQRKTKWKAIHKAMRKDPKRDG